MFSLPYRKAKLVTRSDILGGEPVFPSSHQSVRHVGALVEPGYYRRRWTALTRFIDDAQVPIDNSPTEREFQNVAKLRLMMLFAGSTEGAHRASVLLGIVSTCRAIGVPVQAYLGWAFERLGTEREKHGLRAEEMTPAAYKAASG